MNFAYTKYKIQPTSTNPNGIVHRPEVILRVIGELGDVYIMALLDTGADESVLPMSLGEAIGARLSLAETVLASGDGGLEFFTASFDGEAHCGTLIPNSTFPSNTT